MFANRLMPVSIINVYMAFIFVYQCFDGCAPDIFNDFYTSNRNVHDHETRQACDLHVLCGRPDIRRNRMEIPDIIKISEYINVFKQRLRNYLLDIGWGVVAMGDLWSIGGGCRSVIMTTFLLQCQQINNVLYMFQFCRNITVCKKNYAFISHVTDLVVMGSVTGRPSLGLLSRFPSMWPGLWGDMSHYL